MNREEIIKLRNEGGELTVEELKTFLNRINKVKIVQRGMRLWVDLEDWKFVVSPDINKSKFKTNITKYGTLNIFKLLNIINTKIDYVSTSTRRWAIDNPEEISNLNLESLFS